MRIYKVQATFSDWLFSDQFQHCRHWEDAHHLREELSRCVSLFDSFLQSSIMYILKPV